MISEENIIRRLEDVDLIIRKQGYYFSILALDDLTINIQDAKYEGNNIDIRFGSSRGLSNEFINTDVRITKTKGKRAYLIYSK